ncbi:hypothetical protein MNB_SV-13-398 [hydrothermal vent metagenome]|uniref:DNA cytosine methyltransferase n=1 Tax=hydrothermal vent metagenome TaxID=652676 RepID=A0A1W1D0J6_9ZZZZ
MNRKKLKVLILYAGIGGNRKELGENYNITAVELDKNIAAVYADFYPNDTVIIGDAMEYLLENFKKFDIIWLSPECPTHSDIRRVGVHGGLHKPVYPNMDLYQIIIFLTHFYQGKWIVENVKPYYEYLIKPTAILGRHPFWTNFDIPVVDFNDDRNHNKIYGGSVVYGVNLKDYKNIGDKRKMLRNMVDPRIGKYLIELATNAIRGETKKISKPYTPNLFEQKVG